MTKQGGFGLQAKIDIACVLTAIVDILDGSEIPAMMKFIADMTPHSATEGYAVRVATGKRSLESFNLVLGWDKGEATHAAMQTVFDSNNVVDFQIISPGSDETLSFQAHVEQISRQAPTEDGYTAEVTITPSGAPTIT